MKFSNYQYFTGKDVIKDCKLTEKTFKTKMEKIARVYKLDVNKYKTNPLESNSGYRFNLYEFELFKVLISCIDSYPLPTSKQGFFNESKREKIKREESFKFVNYINIISQTIDSIKNTELKAHIYASKIYSETMEWLSAQEKVNTSLSFFFNYTSSLSPSKSAKLHRELSDAIDNILFNHCLDNFTDFEGNLNFKYYYNQMYPSLDSLFESNVENLEIDEKLIDEYIIYLLNKLYLEPLSTRIAKEINNHRKMNVRNVNYEKIRKEEIHKYPFGVNAYFSLIQSSHYSNYLKISDAINLYKANAYKWQNIENKLEKIINSKNPIIKNDNFYKHFYDFYLSLSKFSNLILINYSNYIDKGVDKNEVEAIIKDLREVYYLIDKYAFSDKITRLSYIDRNNLFNALDKFKNIKNNYQSLNIHARNLSGDYIAEQLNDHLKHLYFKQ